MNQAHWNISETIMAETKMFWWQDFLNILCLSTWSVVKDSSRFLPSHFSSLQSTIKSGERNQAISKFHHLCFLGFSVASPWFWNTDARRVGDTIKPRLQSGLMISQDWCWMSDVKLSPLVALLFDDSQLNCIGFDVFQTQTHQHQQAEAESMHCTSAVNWVQKFVFVLLVYNVYYTIIHLQIFFAIVIFSSTPANISCSCFFFHTCIISFCLY